MLGILHPTTLSPGGLVDIGLVSGGVLFDLILLAHVVFALVGFSAVALTGYNAQRLRRLAAPGRPGSSRGGDDPGSAARLESLRRFFKPGPNLAARSIYLVGVAGVVLLAGWGRPAWMLRPWLLAGTALWAFCVVTGEVLLWPAERVLQESLATPMPGALRGTGSAARRVVAAAAVVDSAYVAAFVLMFAQPR